MKKTFPVVSMVFVLMGVRLYAQEDTVSSFHKASWFITASLGSPAIGPAWSIGKAMTKIGYDKTQTNHFLYTTVTKHPDTRYYFFEKVPWNVTLRYRFAANYLVSASLEHTMVLHTSGFNGQHNIGVAHYMKSYSTAVLKMFGEHPSYVWCGAGPSLHQINLGPYHFLLDKPETVRKVGITAQAGIIAMISNSLYMEISAHLRYVGSIFIDRSTLSLIPAAQLSSIEADFNHIFLSVGVGTGF